MLNWDDPLAKPIEETNTVIVEQALKQPELEITETQDLTMMTERLSPVNPNDKRVINGKTDINQLAPFKYPWAWSYFLNANKNHWTPLDINMAQDVTDYRHKLTLEEKHVYENVLSYLTTSDILAMRNIGLAVMEKMSAPELQIYQARQVYEEALHTWTYRLSRVGAPRLRRHTGVVIGQPGGCGAPGVLLEAEHLNDAAGVA